MSDKILKTRNFLISRHASLFMTATSTRQPQIHFAPKTWGVVWAAIFLATPAQSQVTSSSPVVGFVKVTLNGSAEGGGNSLLGPALVEKTDYQGDIDSGVPTAFSLTDSDANWTTNLFDTHPTANSHYVEIIASSNANSVGLVTDIVSHTTKTLTTLDDLSTYLLGGETIAIRRHKTISDLFGSTNEAGLGQGDSTSADNISVLTAGTNPGFSSYYYRSGTGFGGTGWRSSSNPLTDQSQTPVKVGDGLLVQRKQGASLEVVIHGYLKTGPLRRLLPTGYSLVDPVAPITDQSGAVPAGAQFTLGGTSSASVVPSGLGDIFSSGTSQTADLISIYSVSGFTSHYLSAGPLGGTGWRSTTNPFSDTHATVLPAATALLIQNRGAAKTWVRPQPFSVAAP